jgi:hypothetical protein
MSDAEREMVRVDGEIFEAVARSQFTDTTGQSTKATTGLRFDARPAGDNADLSGAPDRPRPLEPGNAGDSVSANAQPVIVEQRKDILRSLGIEEGGPFSYPECGGARTRRTRDSTNTLPPPACPDSPLRYVTVGLPYRGASPVLARARLPGTPAPDSTGEQWTVLVTESSVGSGGQQWRQYVTLFRRDPETGRLAMAERVLLSWAE